MKILMLGIVIVSTQCLARSTMADFNQELANGFKAEVTKDDEKFKRAPGRGPASVVAVEKVKLEGPEQIEKNVKQLGRPNW